MPGRISPEPRVRVRKCSHGGVIKSRFCASEKNANTFSRDCGNQSCEWKFRTHRVKPFPKSSPCSVLPSRRRHRDGRRANGSPKYDLDGSESDLLYSAGVAGFLVRNRSINRCLPQGDTMSKTACPSHIIEIVFFSLGDGVCASAAPAIAKATKREIRIRIPNLFIRVPIIRRRASRRI